jgi:hypothetical protein
VPAGGVRAEGTMANGMPAAAFEGAGIYQQCSTAPLALRITLRSVFEIKRAHQSQDGRHSLFFDSYMIICCSR